VFAFALARAATLLCTLVYSPQQLLSLPALMVPQTQPIARSAPFGRRTRGVNGPMGIERTEKEFERSSIFDVHCELLLSGASQTVPLTRRVLPSFWLLRDMNQGIVGT
jgi:hypothetical protein